MPHPQPQATILAKFEREAWELSTDKIARANRLLTAPEKGETIIGVVEDEYCKRLWALATEYRRLRDLATHAAQYDSNSGEQVEDCLAEARRFDLMDDVVREVAWLEIRSLFPAVFQRPNTIGMRQNFTLVTMSEDPRETMETMLQKSLERVQQSLIKALGAPDDDDEEKPKIQ